MPRTGHHPQAPRNPVSRLDDQGFRASAVETGFLAHGPQPPHPGSIHRDSGDQKLALLP